MKPLLYVHNLVSKGSSEFIFYRLVARKIKFCLCVILVVKSQKSRNTGTDAIYNYSVLCNQIFSTTVHFVKVGF